MSEETGMERKPFAKGVKAKAISYSQPFAEVCLDLSFVAGEKDSNTYERVLVAVINGSAEYPPNQNPRER